MSISKKVIYPAIITGSFVLAYLPIWRNLILTWSHSDDYSHGFLIVPICIYILWGKREAVSKKEIKPSNWGVVVLILSLLVYLLSYFSEIATMASFSMIPLISGVVIWFYGFGVFRELLFPILFLMFMIPIPDQIYSLSTIPLQLFVSKMSALTVSHMGIPIYREGNVLHLSEKTFQVVNACSGLRSLISLSTLSIIWAYLTLKSNILRGLLAMSALPVAIIVNILRVILMVTAFYYWRLDLAQGTIHTLLGLVVFVLAFVIIGLIKGILSHWDPSATPKQ